MIVLSTYTLEVKPTIKIIAQTQFWMIKLPYKTIVDLVKVPSFFNGRLGLIFCIHIYILLQVLGWQPWVSKVFSSLVANPEGGREPQAFRSLLRPPGSYSVLAEF